MKPNPTRSALLALIGLVLIATLSGCINLGEEQAHERATQHFFQQSPAAHAAFFRGGSL